MMMKRNHEMPRLIAMFLVMLLMMMACLYMSATAYAADDPYKITITPPGGWASGTNVSVKIAVTDKQGHGWNTVEYALNNSGWIDITRMMTEGMTSLSVSENGQMTVRVTDNDGLQYEESMNILCLDADAPVVKAEIQESTLHVEVTDNISGIAGVQVGSMLFTTVENSALDIALDETMNKFEKLAVRAFDYAGNFSDPITLDNPNYHVEPDITPEPVNTPAPVETEKPKKPEKKETASEKKDEKEDEKPADVPAADADKSNQGLAFEVTDRREETVKHFRLSDGTYAAVQYDVPVHTLDDDGVWQDIDNTLTDVGSAFATSNARVKFAKKIPGNESLFTLHDGNAKVTVSLNGATKKTTGVVTNTHTELDENAAELQKLMQLDKLSSRILYAEIMDGVDIEYVVESLNIKENIIVKERLSDYSFSFTLALNNLTAELTDAGEVCLLDSDRSVAYVIPAGYMIDADGVLHPVSLELLGKARELAKKIKHPVTALVIGIVILVILMILFPQIVTFLPKAIG